MDTEEKKVCDCGSGKSAEECCAKSSEATETPETETTESETPEAESAE